MTTTPGARAGRTRRDVVAAAVEVWAVDNAIVDPETWETDAGPDPFSVVVERGRRDGSLTADVPAEWAVIQCWTALFGAHLATGSDDLRHHAGDLVAHTLLRGLGG